MLKKIAGICMLILSVSPVSFSSRPDEPRASSGATSDASNGDIDPESFYSFFYTALKSDVPKPDYEVFTTALTGFFNLKAGGLIRSNILTVIDFSISSCLERMWIIDMKKMEVVHVSLVAHGRNSGEEYASHFSNAPSSNKSSIGFYLTDGIYYGRHGVSLYLNGVESGVNDKARERAIVMHGADYVSRDYIKNYGRLGRSYGCPSFPLKDHEEIIKLLSEGSCMFIYYPDDKYRSSSSVLTSGAALAGINNFLEEVPAIHDYLAESHLIARNY
jgi:hypothetical protein